MNNACRATLAVTPRTYLGWLSTCYVLFSLTIDKLFPDGEARQDAVLLMGKNAVGARVNKNTTKGWEIRGKRIKCKSSFQQRASKLPLVTSVKQERIQMVSSLA